MARRRRHSNTSWSWAPRRTVRLSSSCAALTAGARATSTSVHTYTVDLHALLCCHVVGANLHFQVPQAQEASGLIGRPSSFHSAGSVHEADSDNHQGGSASCSHILPCHTFPFRVTSNPQSTGPYSPPHNRDASASARLPSPLPCCIQTLRCEASHSGGGGLSGRIALR